MTKVPFTVGKPAKLGLALFAALSLTVTATVSFGSAAHAADITVDPATEIAGYEDGAEGTAGYNYDTWHIGSVDTPGTDVAASLEFEEGQCGVTFLDASLTDPEARKYTQLLKGFTPGEGNDGQGKRIEGVDDIEAFINTLGTDATGNTVTYQLPIFVYEESVQSDFFTMVITPNQDGTVDGDSRATMSGDSNTEVSVEFALSSLQEGQEEGIGFVLLGAGLGGNEGTEVSWMSFGGDTYYFGDCIEAPVEETPEPEAEEKTPTIPQRVETAALGK